MKKKYLLSIVSVVIASVLALGLGACGNNGEEFDPDDREQVTITFWHSLTGVHFDAVQALVDAFEASQPYVTVEHVFQGNPTQLNQVLMANAVAGTLPHITILNNVQIPHYIESNLLHPLNPFFENPYLGMTEEEIDDIIEIFRNNSKWGDEWFSVPFGKSTRVLYYNRDMLDAAGLEVPTTWAELREAAEILTEGERVGFGFENAWGAEFQALLMQHGGVYINEETRTAEFASEAGLAAMEFIAELVQSPYGRLAGEDGFMSGVFGSHQAAMYIGSSAGLPHVIGAMQPGTNWGTAPTPTLDGFMSVQFAGPDAILLQSPNHTAAEVWGAWEFLRFTLQPEVTAQFAIDSGYIPVRYSARELPIFAEYLEDFPLARAASIQFENGFFIPRLPESSEIGSTLATQQERILLGLVSVEEGMQYAEDRANEILGR